MPPHAPLPDAHWSPALSARPSASVRRPARRESRYVAMRDGVRIAIDLYLPADREPGTKLPTILRPTRYFRATAVRRPFHLLPVAELPDLYAEARRRFLAAGYAWVDMDVRGSGASFGRQAYPWAADEVRDEGEVVDWVVAQPWSNGLLGALGVSYDGTASELLLTQRHPAVRAVAPMFSLFDAYADVAFPGGIHLARFTESWGSFNAALDRNDNPAAMTMALWLTLRSAHPGGAVGRPAQERILGTVLDRLPEPTLQRVVRGTLGAMLAGVRPVDEDASGSLLAAAIAEHATNFDVHEAMGRVRARDDRGLSTELPDETIDVCSPHRHAAELRASGAAVYGISGWRDGAYQRSAIHRHLTVGNPGSRLLLGPLCHGGKLYVSPGRPTRPTVLDLDGELLRFFDLHLRDRDDGIGAEPAVRYYTTGEEAWKSAPSWPPPGTRTRVLHLDAERALAWEEEGNERAQGGDEVTVDGTTGTGERSRWRGLVSPLVQSDYADWDARKAQRLSYTSAPLPADLEVTGHPMLTLQITSRAPDATVFAYLEEVTAEGSVHYVTEGQLRARYRALSAEAPYTSVVPYRAFAQTEAAPLLPGEAAELRFDLLPISHRFQRGSRLRLSLAGEDRDHFAAPPEGGSFQVLRGPGRGSRLELPVMDA
ncbi:CocE/NonD family hydrolase [Chondromyces apiculatus]|uniref:Glutaryl-7-ACA acylase n=1 Tax=Chondromyces apiculatus DSM 436 TaxID=1192034 RepID=A0A017T8I3_9BACT|nr:CocE/NonD family hydrolase [Chondromyces apiculatus]EYF05115.1 Glutaryl-7-ACA acylase [Chondromyces apiculatus DSM 436]